MIALPFSLNNPDAARRFRFHHTGCRVTPDFPHCESVNNQADIFYHLAQRHLRAVRNRFREKAVTDHQKIGSRKQIP